MCDRERRQPERTSPGPDVAVTPKQSLLKSQHFELLIAVINISLLPVTDSGLGV